jgi:hypothetical protein
MEPDMLDENMLDDDWWISDDVLYGYLDTLDPIDIYLSIR